MGRLTAAGQLALLLAMSLAIMAAIPQTAGKSIGTTMRLINEQLCG
jgi:hypothetical protein